MFTTPEVIFPIVTLIAGALNLWASQNIKSAFLTLKIEFIERMARTETQCSVLQASLEILKANAKNPMRKA